MCSGADPLAAGGGSSLAPPPPPSSHPSAAHPNQHILDAARQQDQVFRDLISRAPYNDPLLAHQVTTTTPLKTIMLSFIKLCAIHYLSIIFFAARTAIFFFQLK